MKKRIDRWWNFPSALILLAALMMTSLKILSTKWTDHLGLLNWFTFIGFILGILLGYSRFKPFLYHLFVFLYTVLIVPYLIGLTSTSTISWIARYESLYGRIQSTIGQIIENVRVEDPILFFLFLSLLVWFTSIYAGLRLTRNSKPWFPVIISGLTIFITEFFDQLGNNLYSAFFVFFILVLVAQINFVEQNRKWRIERIPVDFEIESVLRRSSLIVAFLIVLFAWNVTNIVSAFQKGTPQQQQIIQIIENVQNRVSKITAPLQGTAYLHSENYADTVNLGTGTNLTDEIVLEITADQKSPSGGRYYWRGKSFDQYLNGQWNSTIQTYKLIEEDTEINDLEEFFFFPERTFKIKTRANLSVLYSPLYPQMVDRAVKAFYLPLPDEHADYIELSLDDIAYSGETYKITNRIPTPTISQMRKSSVDYPDWVSEYYLQLPDNFSNEIKNLAQEITQPYSDPYEQTLAITNYLRRNIKYNEKIIDPPEGVDLMEWFLFDYQEGFCNYYATAEVLMLRSVGIPARIVFGYAQGTTQDNNETEYIVRRKQSHAWPEVYFTGIGWVEFEPTTIQPSIDRLLGDAVPSINQEPFTRDPNRSDLPILDGGEINEPVVGADPNDVLNLDEQEIQIQTTQPSVFPFVIMGIVTLFSVYIMFSRSNKPEIPSAPVRIENFLVRRGWKVPAWIKSWANYNKSTIPQKAFLRIIWSLEIFNKKVPKFYTPAEVIQEFKIIFPQMAPNADEFLNNFQRAIYSTHPIDPKTIFDQGNKIFRFSLGMKVKNLFQSRRYA